MPDYSPTAENQSKQWQEDAPRNLTYGCISMHNREIIALYDQVHIGTTVIILP